MCWHHQLLVCVRGWLTIYRTRPWQHLPQHGCVCVTDKAHVQHGTHTARTSRLLRCEHSD